MMMMMMTNDEARLSMSTKDIDSRYFVFSDGVLIFCECGDWFTPCPVSHEVRLCKSIPRSLPLSEDNYPQTIRTPISQEHFHTLEKAYLDASASIVKYIDFRFLLDNSSEEYSALIREKHREEMARILKLWSKFAKFVLNKRNYRMLQ